MEDSLLGFVKEVDKDIAIQKRIKNCKNSSQLMALISETGYRLKLQEIIKRRTDLTADYWPWAEFSRVEREKWFELDNDG